MCGEANFNEKSVLQLTPSVRYRNAELSGGLSGSKGSLLMQSGPSERTRAPLTLDVFDELWTKGIPYGEDVPPGS